MGRNMCIIYDIIKGGYYYAFEFMDLPYAPDALEPHIDKMTMEIHYGKHHRTYYDKMNDSLKGSEAAVMSIERLLGAFPRSGKRCKTTPAGITIIISFGLHIAFRRQRPDRRLGRRDLPHL